jgi:hypothetical protein
MGDWTFSEFKRYLKFRFTKRADIENFEGVNLYESALNAAYMALATRKQIFQVRMNLRFPELETTDATTGTSTVDGTATIAKASAAVQIIDVYDATNNVSLDWIPLKKYLDYTDRYDTGAEAAPTEWTRSGGYIYLHPTPGAVYKIYQYFRKRPDLLAAINDVTVIGPEWDEPIMEFATYKLLMWFNEFDKAKFVKEEFLDMVIGILGMYEAEETSRKEHLRPAPGLRDPGRR